MLTRTRQAKVAGRAAVLLACGLFSACTAIGLASRVEPSGFLEDYSQLKKSRDYPEALVYARPGTEWSQYDAIQLESVTLWGTDATACPSAQRLADGLYAALSSELKKFFELTSAPDRTTLRLRVALTRARATTLLNTATGVVSRFNDADARVPLDDVTSDVLSDARVEMEVVDPGGTERLAAALDERVGAKLLLGKPAFATWADVRTASYRWSKRIALQLFHMGVRRKPGVPIVKVRPRNHRVWAMLREPCRDSLPRSTRCSAVRLGAGGELNVAPWPRGAFVQASGLA